MKIRPVGAELLHADRWMEGGTDRQTGWSQQSLFAILRIRLKKGIGQGKTISEHIMKGHGEVEVLSLWKPFQYAD